MPFLASHPKLNFAVKAARALDATFNVAQIAKTVLDLTILGAAPTFGGLAFAVGGMLAPAAVSGLLRRGFSCNVKGYFDEKLTSFGEIAKTVGKFVVPAAVSGLLRDAAPCAVQTRRSAERPTLSVSAPSSRRANYYFESTQTPFVACAAPGRYKAALVVRNAEGAAQTAYRVGHSAFALGNAPARSCISVC